jgi:chromosome partitioning protein
MGHVLSFAMQKGGVGKTTTALNVGAILAARGARVLLIDVDPQANLTQGLGIDPSTIEYSTYEVLVNPEHGTAFATVATPAGVDLVPANLDLAGAEMELASKVAREGLLRKALRETRERYDYVLIDPPPSLGLFTLNALAAADAVIVPLQAQAYAFRAMPQLEVTIDLVREINPALRIGGIVCTIVDSGTNLGRSVERQIRARYGDLVFGTTIPRNVKLAEAPAAGEPINAYAPSSSGALAYQALTAEIEARYGR